MLARPLVLHCLLQLLKLEDLAINNRLQLLGVRIDCCAHLLHQYPVTDQQTTGDAHAVQALDEAWLLGLKSTNEANDGDDAVETDGLETLSHRSWAGNLDDVMHTQTI